MADHSDHGEHAVEDHQEYQECHSNPQPTQLSPPPPVVSASGDLPAQKEHEHSEDQLSRMQREVTVCFVHGVPQNVCPCNHASIIP